LMLCEAGSRALLAAAMWREPLARSDGLAASAGRPTQATMLWAIGLGALIAVGCAGVGGIVAAARGGVGALGVAALAPRQLGGVTGDVLGAIQQGGEIAMLLTLVALD